MATKELMISDWVHSTRYNVDAKIIDVNHDSVWLEVNGQWLRHLEEDVEPIKLTNEIMEKNFPDYEPGYTIGWWPNGDSSFHVEWQEDLEGNQVILKHVMYVHELQHILRMVKCEKEIELI